MLSFKREIKIEEFHSKAFDLYFGGRDFAAFDIETTGLSPANSKIMLAGFFIVKDGLGKSIQYFADTYREEKNVIASALETIAALDTVVTYNGKSFDLPFIKARAEACSLPAPKVYDLDLYTLVRSYSDIRSSAGSLSQKSLERYMGISHLRNDLISGGESIDLYQKYLAEPSDLLLDKILLHNLDDVMQLYRLLPVLSGLDLHKAMSAQGFPVRAFSHDLSHYGYIVDNIYINRSEIKVSLHGEVPDYISFPSEKIPFRVDSSSATGKCEIIFYTEQASEGVMILDLEGIYSGLSSCCDDMIHSSSLNSKGKDPGTSRSHINTDIPGISSGYLIVENSGVVNHAGVNAFVIDFLSRYTFV